MLEGDKEAYVEEASKALRRQRKISDDLKKEKRELLSLLSTTRSRSSSRKESENAAKLSRLAEEQVPCHRIAPVIVSKLISSHAYSHRRVSFPIFAMRRTSSVIWLSR